MPFAAAPFAPFAPFTLFALFALFTLSLAFWPVDVLVVRPFAPGSPVQPVQKEEPPLFALPMPLGREFGTGYIHSVQRTPVLDAYRIVNGRLWSWREYTQSHNAGLPFQAPAFGRFRMLRRPWMAVEGGRQAWPRIVLRVGNAELGRNVLAWERGSDMARMDLYALWPGRRLVLGVERLPLSLAH
jgi:hypothetical protein